MAHSNEPLLAINLVLLTENIMGMRLYAEIIVISMGSLPKRGVHSSVTRLSAG